jgi:hypothetical protein
LRVIRANAGAAAGLSGSNGLRKRSANLRMSGRAGPAGKARVSIGTSSGGAMNTREASPARASGS